MFVLVSTYNKKKAELVDMQKIAEKAQAIAEHAINSMNKQRDELNTLLIKSCKQTEDAIKEGKRAHNLAIEFKETAATCAAINGKLLNTIEQMKKDYEINTIN